MNLDTVRSSVDDLISALSLIKKSIDAGEVMHFSEECYSDRDIVDSDINSIYVYKHPVSIWVPNRTYKKRDMCPACNNGLKQVKDSFYTHYTYCDCMNYDPEYTPVEHVVQYILFDRASGAKFFVCSDGVRYNDDMVCSTYSKAVWTRYDLDTYAFINEEDCRKACEVLNGKQ